MFSSLCRLEEESVILRDVEVVVGWAAAERGSWWEPLWRSLTGGSTEYPCCVLSAASTVLGRCCCWLLLLLCCELPLDDVDPKLLLDVRPLDNIPRYGPGSDILR